MTVSTQHVSDTHIGNSATLAFPITFQFYSGNDIVVQFDDGINPPVNQLPGSYTITGGNGSTGTITFLVVPPAGIQVIVNRVMSLIQQASYTRNDPFPSATHEIALDRIVMMIQQTLAGASAAGSVTPEFIQDIVGAMLTVNPSSGVTFTYDDIVGVVTALVTATGIADAPLDSKYYVRRNANWIEEAWANIAGKPSTFAPSAHTHPSSDIIDLTVTTQDTVAPMFNHSGHTNLAFVYDSVTKKISGIAVGSSGSTAQYDWADGITIVDPGAGKISCNNANLNAATRILISNTNKLGLVTNFATALVNDTIVLNDVTSVAMGVYKITGIVYSAGYIDFTVTVNAPLSTGNPLTADVINASLVVTNASAGISDAPADGVNYGRKNTVWTVINWTDIVGKPGSFVPSAHNHPASDITDFAEAADDRIASLLVAGAGITLTYNDLANTLTVTAVSAPAAVVISDTVPVSPTVGMLWWNSLDATLYLRYDDGTSVQWVPTSLTAFSTVAIPFMFDNGTNPVPAGAKAWFEIPFACILTGNTLMSDVSATAVLDVWVDTYGNYPPTVLDTITAAAKPTLTAAIKSQDNTLTGWILAIAAGSIVMVNIDSNNNATKLNLSLKAVKL